MGDGPPRLRGARVAALAAVALVAAFPRVAATRGDLSSFINPQSSDAFDVYLFEAPVPFVASTDPAPRSVLAVNGHIGIGFRNMDRHRQEFSVELVPQNATGVFVPSLYNTSIAWHNRADLVITKPVNVTSWSSASYLGEASGSAIDQLRGWLNDHTWRFERYQPFTVSYSGKGVIYAPVDSFSLARDIIENLANNGVELKPYLNVFPATTNTYWSNSSELEIVDENGKYYDDIRRFYASLSVCLATIHNATFVSLARALPSCYEGGEVVYVYYGTSEEDDNYGVTQYVRVQLVDEDPVEVRREFTELPDAESQETTGGLAGDVIAMLTLTIMLITGFAFLLGIQAARRREGRNASLGSVALSARLLDNMDATSSMPPGAAGKALEAGGASKQAAAAPAGEGAQRQT